MAETPGFAPAKVNLSLHVVGQRNDGFHQLDSLVAFADIGDRLTAQAAEVASLVVTGPMAEGVPTDRRNLVLKAAEWLGITAAFTLEKHLPSAAGIGGGSSDAAAALRLLAALSGKPIPAGAEALGADVPVCLLPGAVRMRGVGERLTPVAIPSLPALLVNPGVTVCTRSVFGALADKSNPAMTEELPRFRDSAGAIGWISAQRNDLQAAAIEVAPEIAAVLHRLSALSAARLVRMSGSGATCFALFDSYEEATAAEAILRAERTDWWLAATRLR